MASFWSKLGKIAKVAAPIGASFIPGVGPAMTAVRAGVGALGSVADVAGDVGRVAGDAAGALRTERFDEDAARRQRDYIAQNRARLKMDQGQTRDAQALERAKFGVAAPQERAKQAAYGDALKNVQDVNIDFQPQTGPATKFNVTGGLRPSMFGETSREAGGELGRQALLALMTGSDTPETSPLVDIPDVSEPKGSGVLEKVTGGVGLGGSILDALGPILSKLKKRGPVATIPTVNRQAQGPPVDLRNINFNRSEMA